MTLDDVLEDIIVLLGSEGDCSLGWELIREWPDGAIEIFQTAEWLKDVNSAKSVVCPGCEENCFMPVHTSSGKTENSFSAYVACDRCDDMGRIPIPPEYLQRWQLTEKQVALWISRELGIKGQLRKDNETGNFLIEGVQGKRKTGCFELVCNEPTSIKISEYSLPLLELVYCDGDQLKFDRRAIFDLIDRPPPSDRYKPSTARREVNKLETQARHKSWQKAYRELKRKNPKKSDNWCALQISNMDIAQGRDSETIRKNMKK
ncbi:MAG: hypothetical protein G3M78_05180 [Candidatus Nitrohelix vancouverensis]|uniref:Uncharacterized protein n=1 Tax=Candidatus Nitrohelix vancouverensis TaxID=2705534 RepID=A0A7T0C1H3_9BACT|nr:MAG: hypothetical protein G3M78_05180 [Candidatus Nitrohelix vancouverensis]